MEWKELPVSPEDSFKFPTEQELIFFVSNLLAKADPDIIQNQLQGSSQMHLHAVFYHPNSHSR